MLAAATTILTAYYTNIRMKKITDDEDILSDKLFSDTQYIPDVRGIATIILIAAISATAAFFVSNNALDIVACTELCLCYLAVLASGIIDYKTMTIPNFICIVIILSKLIIMAYELIASKDVITQLISSLIGCFLSFVILCIAQKISKGGIGNGDIKLICSIGFACGFYAVFTTLILSLTVCIVLSFLLIILKKCNKKDHLPFGPFIFLGYTLMLLLTLY